MRAHNYTPSLTKRWTNKKALPLHKVCDNKESTCEAPGKEREIRGGEGESRMNPEITDAAHNTVWYHSCKVQHAGQKQKKFCSRAYLVLRSTYFIYLY